MLTTLLGIVVAAALVSFFVGDWVRHPQDVDETGEGPSPQLRRPVRSVRPSAEHRRSAE